MDEYGLVGFPLKHSFSQRFFTDKFNKELINASYSNFELDSIVKIINIVQSRKDLKGFNVTIPYKQDIVRYLDFIGEEANGIGAVNVVKIDRTRDGKNGSGLFLSGYNSDAFGFKNSLLPLLDIRKRKALVLGTGGASKAVVYVLHNLGIDHQYVSRERKEGILCYDDLSKNVIEEYELIVNCTPLGTSPDVNQCPAIPYQYLTSNHILYDLVYNPEETLFLKKGKEKKATVKNGYEMLELQALEAWNIWNEKK